jgi:hypothetical protein
MKADITALKKEVEILKSKKWSSYLKRR